MKLAVIALGANLGPKAETISAAIALIAKRIGTIKKQSTIVETAPMVLPGVDATEVPSYLNGAVLVETSLSSEQILTELLEIEIQLGRDRAVETSRWMSRVIDLDLICVDQEVVSSEFLRIPHPEMHKRDFVLLPMAEIYPDWIHPLLKKSVTDLIAALE